MSHYMKNKNENRTYLNLLATEYISPGCYGVSRFYPPLRGIVTGYFWNFDHFEKIALIEHERRLRIQKLKCLAQKKNWWNGKGLKNCGEMQNWNIFENGDLLY